MKPTILTALLFINAVMLVTPPAYAAIDNNASVVKLMANKADGTSGCIANGATLDDCFTSMASLRSWLVGTRMPKAAAPLIVDVGPGTFGSLSLSCGGTWGYTTFRGAGRKHTTIGTSSNVAYSLNLLNCASMHFKDMAIGPLPTPAFGGINWQGTGTSTWENVDLFSAHVYGWQDVTSGCTTSGPRGAHYWFNSRIVSTSNDGAARPYISQCSEDWFFGSEITIKPRGDILDDAFALKAAGPAGEIHFYGGVLRVVTTPGISVSTATGTGIAWVIGGSIHIHGTGLDVLSANPNPVTVLRAENGGEIHANEAAYNLKSAAGGAITRILNLGGHIHAPYAWEPHPDVPFAGSGVNYNSVSGADSAFITSTVDGHPHMVVYDASCASKWYDTSVKLCR